MCDLGREAGPEEGILTSNIQLPTSKLVEELIPPQESTAVFSQVQRPVRFGNKRGCESIIFGLWMRILVYRCRSRI